VIEDIIPKDFIKTYEAEQRLSISRNTLYKWLELGLIKSVRVGETILIPLSEIDRLKKEAK
jgi:excisionase family DNA binding protein